MSEERCYFVKGIINSNRIREAITSVSLKKLGSNSIEKMVSSFLGFDSQSICHLVKLITHKTQGNVFHILEYLDSIKREKLLSILGDALSIDMESIQIEMIVLNSLVQSFSQKFP